MPAKFLIIQTAFIGDVVLATSLVENIHASFPDASIDFLVRLGNESLLQGHPHIRRVLIWNKKEKKIPNLFKMLRAIRKEKYDKVINVQRYAATGILTAFSGAKQKIGFDKNPFSFLFSRKVVGANVVLTQSTKIIDVSGSSPVEYKGRVPARSVVIPGSYKKQFPAGEYAVSCALIIGQRKPSTDLKTSLNDALREFNVSV